VSDGTGAHRARIAVVADDLIWATRLRDGVARAGGEPVGVRSTATLATLLPSVGGCVVDLTARAYDGIDAVRASAEAAVPVIAVGQHDDADARRRATDAGATRVYAYRALFEHGDRVLAAWIGSLTADADGSDDDVADAADPTATTDTEAPMPGPAPTPEHVA
jgi:DNA-binding NarL/FixJ family response regulator